MKYGQVNEFFEKEKGFIKWYKGEICPADDKKADDDDEDKDYVRELEKGEWNITKNVTWGDFEGAWIATNHSENAGKGNDPDAVSEGHQYNLTISNKSITWNDNNKTYPRSEVKIDPNATNQLSIVTGGNETINL